MNLFLVHFKHRITKLKLYNHVFLIMCNGLFEVEKTHHISPHDTVPSIWSCCTYLLCDCGWWTCEPNANDPPNRRCWTANQWLLRTLWSAGETSQHTGQLSLISTNETHEKCHANLNICYSVFYKESMNVLCIIITACLLHIKNVGLMVAILTIITEPLLCRSRWLHMWHYLWDGTNNFINPALLLGGKLHLALQLEYRTNRWNDEEFSSSIKDPPLNKWTS